MAEFGSLVKIHNILVTEMIATDNQPFTFVSGIGFRRLVAAMEPRYNLKTEKFLPQRHPRWYRCKSWEESISTDCRGCSLFFIFHNRLLVWGHWSTDEPNMSFHWRQLGRETSCPKCQGHVLLPHWGVQQQHVHQPKFLVLATLLDPRYKGHVFFCNV